MQKCLQLSITACIISGVMSGIMAGCMSPAADDNGALNGAPSRPVSIVSGAVSQSSESNDNDDNNELASTRDAGLAMSGDLVWTEQQRLAPTRSVARERLGFAVAVDGSTAMASTLDYRTVYIYKFADGGWQRQGAIIKPDLTVDDCFGTRIAVSGDTAVIGAGCNSGSSERTGAAYVYVNKGTRWELLQKLVPADADDSDAFGSAVDINGDTIILSAENAAYIYTRDTGGWRQEDKLYLSDPNPLDKFGTGVAVSGDITVVGAPWDGEIAEQAGAAYIFKRNNSKWDQVQKLTVSDGGVRHGFGRSVAVAGNTILVGASGADGDGVPATGAVYAFELEVDKWVPTDKLLADDGIPGAIFGNTVVLDGDNALINTGPHNDVYIFSKQISRWTQVAHFSQPSDIQSFGWSIGLSGDLGMVGLLMHHDTAYMSGSVFGLQYADGAWQMEIVRHTESAIGGGEDAGRSMDLDGDTLVVGGNGYAWVYEKFAGLWRRTQTLFPHLPQSGDRFGDSVAVMGDTIMVGNPRRTDSVDNAGEVVVFHKLDDHWDLQQVINEPTLQQYGYFGQSLAFYDDSTVLIGRPCMDSLTSLPPGRVYVFKKGATGSWNADAEISSETAESMDQFGITLASDGARVIIGGADAAFIAAQNSGDWDVRQSLTPDEGVIAESGYGYDVAVSGDRALVGAPYWRDGEALNEGNVYVFERQADAWTHTQSLHPDTLVALDMFGYGLDLISNRAIIGAFSSTPTSTGLVGHAYIFEVQDGTLSQTARISQPEGDYQFAKNVLLDTTSLFIAAPRASEVSGASGVIGVYELSGDIGIDCGADADCASGYCVDGVCCDASCGGNNPDDCQACAIAAGATVNGVCETLTSDRRCRESHGDCDAAEYCDGAAIDCPEDLLKAAGSICRSPLGLCDIEETCDGVQLACPADHFAAAGQTCRVSQHQCDVSETCGGDTPYCPADTTLQSGETCNDGDALTHSDQCTVDAQCVGTYYTGSCLAPHEVASLPFSHTASTADNIDSLRDYGANCTGSWLSAPDAAYTVDMTAGQQIEVTVTPDSGFNVALEFIQNCAPSSECLDAVNDGGAGTAEQLSYIATETTRIIIVVEGAAHTQSGGYTIEINEWHSETDSESDSDTAAYKQDTNTDSDSDTVPDPDIESDGDTATDSDSDFDSGADAGSDTEIEHLTTDTVSDTFPGPDHDTDTSFPADTASDSQYWDSDTLGGTDSSRETESDTVTSLSINTDSDKDISSDTAPPQDTTLGTDTAFSPSPGSDLNTDADATTEVDSTTETATPNANTNDTAKTDTDSSPGEDAPYGGGCNCAAGAGADNERHLPQIWSLLL